MEPQSLLKHTESVLSFPLFHLGSTTFTPTNLLLLAAAVVALFWLTGRLRDFIVNGPLARRDVDVGVRWAIAAMVRYGVVLLGLLAILSTLGVKMDALTVVAGAVGVGIGFGLQQITSNFVSGLILLVERPIKVGDRIDVGGINGDVVKIAPRATTILTNDNIAIIVPNSSFVTETVVNWSYSDRNVRFSVPVGVAYGSDTALVERVLLEVARENPGVLNEPPADVLFDGFGDSSLNFVLRVWTREYTTRPMILRSQLNFAIDRAFRERGVEIPFPQRDLHVRSGRLEVASAPSPADAERAT
jgi:small-conductance mechanosensitive channel